jgi:hypothetical protein
VVPELTISHIIFLNDAVEGATVPANIIGTSMVVVLGTPEIFVTGTKEYTGK